MASIYTKEELIEQIKEIDNMIRASNGIQSYSIGDGQGTQSATRYSLSQLKDLRKELMSELASIDSSYARKPYRIGVTF